jgi:hypothetical protein
MSADFRNTDNWTYLRVSDLASPLQDPSFSIRTHGETYEPYLVGGRRSQSEEWNTPPTQFGKDGALWLALPFDLLKVIEIHTAYTVRLRETKQEFTIQLGGAKDPGHPDDWRMDERPTSVRIVSTQNWTYLHVEGVRENVNYGQFWLRPHDGGEKYLLDGGWQTDKAYNAAPRIDSLADGAVRAALPFEIIKLLPTRPEWEVGFEGDRDSFVFATEGWSAPAHAAKGWLRDGRTLDVAIAVKRWVYLSVPQTAEAAKAPRFALASCEREPKPLAPDGGEGAKQWIAPAYAADSDGRRLLALPKAVVDALRSRAEWEVEFEGVGGRGLLLVPDLPALDSDGGWTRDWTAEPQETKLPVEKVEPPVEKPAIVEGPEKTFEPTPPLPWRSRLLGSRLLLGLTAALIGLVAGYALARLLTRPSPSETLLQSLQTKVTQLQDKLDAASEDSKVNHAVALAFYDPQFLRSILGADASREDSDRIHNYVLKCEKNAAHYDAPGVRAADPSAAPRDLQLSMARNFAVLRGDCVYRWALEPAAPNEPDRQAKLFAALRSGRRQAATKLSDGRLEPARHTLEDQVFAFKYLELAAILGAMEDGGRVVKPSDDTVAPYIEAFRTAGPALFPSRFETDVRTRVQDAFPR